MPSQLNLCEALQNRRVRRRLAWLALIVAAMVGIAVAGPPTREQPEPWTGSTGA